MIVIIHNLKRKTTTIRTKTTTLRLGQMTTEELEDFKKMCENPEKIYVPEEDFDAIIKALDDPPKYMIGLANLMKRKLP